MSLLNPGLLTRLKRTRLVTRTAFPASGIGERQSRNKGAGLEFEDYREYQPGDDIRHLDPHVYSRLGTHVVRQFALSQQLQVTVLVDCSKSMDAGSPSKHTVALQLAAMMAYMSAAGGDRVSVAKYASGQLHWFPAFSNARQTAELFRWLESGDASGETALQQLAQKSATGLQAGGMLIVISDWLAPDFREAINTWRSRGQEIVGLQVLTPEELDPAEAGRGPLVMSDAETGAELEITLNEASLASYRKVLNDWLTTLRQELRGFAGHHVLVRTDSSLEHDVLADWQRNRLVR